MKNDVENLKPDTKPNNGKKTAGAKRIKWTVELRREFLRDCDTMSPEAVKRKWGFSSVSSVFTTKYNCKNVLKDIKEDATDGKDDSRKEANGC